MEDCSLLFETIYNFRHPLFEKKQHARSSCTFDTSAMLVDLRAWRKDDIPSKLLEHLAPMRRAEGLYLPMQDMAGAAVRLT